MRYTHIAFDIDGTLIDTQDTFTYSFARTIKVIKGEDVSPDDLVKYFGLPSSVGIDRVGFPDPVEALEIWEQYYREMALEKSRPYPGVFDAIRAISAAGIRMGIITSRSREEYEADRNMDLWRKYFDAVICATDTERHKPDPEPALALAAVFGVDAKNCIYMGDTLVDAKCATSAGMDFALADWCGNAAGIPCKYRFTNAEELLKIVL